MQKNATLNIPDRVGPFITNPPLTRFTTLPEEKKEEKIKHLRFKALLFLYQPSLATARWM